MPHVCIDASDQAHALRYQDGPEGMVMIEPVQALEGAKLLRDGSTDEDVEQQTGLSLVHIIELRAQAAAAPRFDIGASPG